MLLWWILRPRKEFYSFFKWLSCSSSILSLIMLSSNNLWITVYTSFSMFSISKVHQALPICLNKFLLDLYAVFKQVSFDNFFSFHFVKLRIWKGLSTCLTKIKIHPKRFPKSWWDIYYLIAYEGVYQFFIFYSDIFSRHF